METIRVRWSDIFDADGERIKPKLPVRIDGQDISPGTSISVSDVSLDGVPFASFLGKDLEVTQERFAGTVEILRYID